MSTYSDDDDWFYDSITRYHTLLNFDFATPVQQIEFVDSSHICLALTEKSGHNEILNLSLPKKITLPSSQQGLEKDTDFKMICGGFSSHSLIQIKALYAKNTILASEKDQRGLSIYKMQSEKTDIISSVGTLEMDHKSPLMTLNKADTLAITTSNKQPVVLIDAATTLQVKGSGLYNEDSPEFDLYPSFTSSHSLGLCNVETGTTGFYDTRAGKTSCTIAVEHSNPARWTLSSSFLSRACEDDGTDENKVGLISSDGTANVYDTRNIQRPLSTADIAKDLKENDINILQNIPTLKFCPENSSQISISGFNSKVYILDTSSEMMKTVFVHDGHVRGSDKSRHLINDHVWYKNMIFSACDNLSMHCWEYSKKLLMQNPTSE